MAIRWLLATSFVFCHCSLLSTAADAQNWQGFRGDGSGVTNPGENLASGKFDLQVEWKQKIGSGYSGIAVRGDRLVTMCTGEEKDLLVCLNASDGQQIWATPIDEKFAGENGSFDGPVATPFISGTTVVGLSAQGKIFAADLSDGKIRWAKKLTDEPIAAKLPMYGFASSPIVVDNTVILGCGGKDAFVCAFDLESGDLKWKTGNDEEATRNLNNVNALFGRKAIKK